MSYRHFGLSSFFVMCGIVLLSFHAQADVQIKDKVIGSLHISQSNETYREEEKTYRETFKKLFLHAQRLKRHVIYVSKFGLLNPQDFYGILIDELNNFVALNQKEYAIDLHLIALDDPTLQIFSKNMESLEKKMQKHIVAEKNDIIKVMNKIYENENGHSDKVTIFQPGGGGLCNAMNKHFDHLRGEKSAELATLVQETYKKVASNLAESHSERNYPFVEIRAEGMTIQTSETRKFNNMHQVHLSGYKTTNKSFALRNVSNDLHVVPFKDLADIFSRIEPKQTENIFTSSFLIYGSTHLNSTQRSDALNQIFVVQDSKIAGNDIKQLIVRAFKDRSTGKFFKQPMLAPSGFSYENDLIVDWIKKYNTDPMTGEPLTVDALRENTFLKMAQDEFESNDDKRQDSLIRYAVSQIKQNEIVNNSVKIFLEAVRDYCMRASEDAPHAQKMRYMTNVTLIKAVFQQAAIPETPYTF